MKKASILILIISFVISGYAQTGKITGSWLMTKAETPEGIQEPYQITDFNEDGKIVIMGIDAGTWKYIQNSNAIVLVSELDKDFNVEAKIVKITEKELVLSKNAVKMFYLKLDNLEIVENNKNSGLMGMWEFNDVPEPELNNLVTFTEPDEFTVIEKEPGMESKIRGTWIFNKHEMSLIMIGMNGENVFKGKNNVTKIDTETVELENNGKVYKGRRKTQNSNKIERLTFTESEFYTEDGEYKYEADKEKLPWNGWEEKRNSLIPVKKLVYNYAVLINGTEAFENKILTADVRANVEYDELHIDYIFNGFDRYKIPEGNEIYQNDEYTMPLYPLYDQIYRLAGHESVTTSAGTFDCTVLETINSSDIAKKLWLINDKPGIYAKIIEDDPDPTFGHYYLYELKEIK